MEYNIGNIQKYYDRFWLYHEEDLIQRGLNESDRLFLREIGLPHEFLGFTFDDLKEWKTCVLSKEKYIQIGMFKPHAYLSHAVYVHVGTGKLFKQSDPDLVLLNRDLKTWFLFHLIFFETAKNYDLKNTEDCNTYGAELRGIYETIDPEAMENGEGYWSTRVEEYEAMW